MINDRTLFLYGPQTSGKTTRLLRIVKRDHGKDILMSGEDRDRVNNGHEVCDVTLRVPKEWTRSSKQRFQQRVREQLPIRHVLIDGAQFLSKKDVKALTSAIRSVDRNVPLIFAGCWYYIAAADRPAKKLPTSRFLMKWCDRSVPVDRSCDFCHRIATRLWIKGLKRLKGHKIVAVDPHLVCDVHYRKLSHN